MNVLQTEGKGSGRGQRRQGNRTQRQTGNRGSRPQAGDILQRSHIRLLPLWPVPVPARQLERSGNIVLVEDSTGRIVLALVYGMRH